MSAGPVEREVLKRLRTTGLTKPEASAMGALAFGVYLRLLRVGSCEVDLAGRARLRVIVAAPHNDIAAAQQRRREEQAERERMMAERERLRREELSLFAGTERLPVELRRAIVEERIAALRDSREWSAEEVG